ncbi:ATP phosphoribosyltransferase regulatory subunit, partial [uncultured Clostridium sp.]|uniref:ATP phosphoribosyltransferase regulatory subunit n=1 Tax=uncultured Clostridium sp. TaxID=59620 RepID=UPI0025CBE05A
MDLFLFIYKGDITLEEFKYLIPEESNDATRMDASLMRTIEGHLRKTFNAHDYQELLLPTFEYADLLSGFGTNEETMFQFINHEGKRITLRTDFTVPIARIYSNAHTDEVRRYSYFGKVYRTQARHKGRSSELFQGGIELFGLP